MTRWALVSLSASASKVSINSKYLKASQCLREALHQGSIPAGTEETSTLGAADAVLREVVAMHDELLWIFTTTNEQAAI